MFRKLHNAIYYLPVIPAFDQVVGFEQAIISNSASLGPFKEFLDVLTCEE